MKGAERRQGTERKANGTEEKRQDRNRREQTREEDAFLRKVAS